MKESRTLGVPRLSPSVAYPLTASKVTEKMEMKGRSGSMIEFRCRKVSVRGILGERRGTDLDDADQPDCEYDPPQVEREQLPSVMSDISRKTFTFHSRFLFVRVFVIRVLKHSHRPFLVDVRSADRESDRIDGDVHQKNDQAIVSYVSAAGDIVGMYVQLYGGSDEGERKDGESSGANCE